MSEFADKVVLVTGGTRGIGRACAEAFAQDGAKVAICGRSEETARAAAGEIGNGVRGYGADMADPEAVDAMVKAITADLGPIAILVNNAGLVRDGLLMRMKNADWDTVIAADLSGPFYCCRAAMRDMLKARWGRIINISSVIGLHGQAGQSNYAAAKAGLIGLSKSLAQELGSRNITVNVVAPGYITTDMTSVIPEEGRKVVMSRTPLGREGTSAEVAACVKFLASEGAAYITGAVLQVDGGLGM
ncbi:MAG: 3-oxoacyl-[acyl-carrier-protein] reductase [FCB group bacterium]|nr:3-oxoacyl-[acyl-carrier-protein] reductase [FCB group bacterium]